MKILLRYLKPDEVDSTLGELGIQPESSISPYKRYLAAFADEKCVGMTRLYEHPEMSNIHIEALEVAEAKYNQGIASAMLEHIFSEAAGLSKAVTNNGFTDMGKQHLIHVVNRLSQKYGIEETGIGRC